MLPPDKTEVDNVYEVRFKNTRKGFFRNVNGLRLYIGDYVVVESDRGYDVGQLSLGGVTAELQMRRKKINKAVLDLPRIYRKANEADLELLKQVRDREQETLVKSRVIIKDLKLEMKLSDVEFQGDNAKAIFYYIADHRVDFRELIKVLAREFRIRVEMKQIGLRYEAGLVGGIGSCGRELCCSTWLTEFKTVSTSAARYQNISLNPMKISGLCGRLKCCLNYELETYLDALDDIPRVDFIETAKGRAFLQKTDIFKRKMWFSYQGETTWYPIAVNEVERIMALNAKGEKPEGALSRAAMLENRVSQESLDFVDVVGTSIPEPEPRRRRGGKGNRRKGPHKGRGGDGNKSRDPRNRNQGGNRKKQNQRNAQGKNQNKSNQGNQGQGKNPQAKTNQGNQKSNNRDQRKPQNKKKGGNPESVGENKKGPRKPPRKGNRNFRRGPKGQGNRNQKGNQNQKDAPKS